jgi:hypothetical protein
VEGSDNTTFGEVSGSHGGEYEDGCLLECCAVALMMEAASTFEMSVNF